MMDFTFTLCFSVAFNVAFSLHLSLCEILAVVSQSSHTTSFTSKTLPWVIIVYLKAILCCLAYCMSNCRML